MADALETIARLEAELNQASRESESLRASLNQALDDNDRLSQEKDEALKERDAAAAEFALIVQQQDPSSTTVSFALPDLRLQSHDGLLSEESAVRFEESPFSNTSWGSEGVSGGDQSLGLAHISREQSDDSAFSASRWVSSLPPTRDSSRTLVDGHSAEHTPAVCHSVHEHDNSGHLKSRAFGKLLRLCGLVMQPSDQEAGVLIAFDEFDSICPMDDRWLILDQAVETTCTRVEAEQTQIAAFADNLGVQGAE